MESRTPQSAATPDARTWDLTLRVIDLTRGRIVADNPFLSSAVGLLRSQPGAGPTAFVTDGRTLFANPRLVLGSFSRTREVPLHDLVHVLMHCVLLHPFVSASVDGPLWDLASDLAVEALVREVCGPRPGERGQLIDAALRQVEGDLGTLTTERLYRALRDGAYEHAREDWGRLCFVDDHGLWPPAQEQAPEQGQTSSAPKQAGQEDRAGSPRETPAPGMSATAGDTNEGAARTSKESRDADGHDGPSDDAGGEGEAQPAGSDGRTQAEPLGDEEREEAERAWKRAAQSMRVDLETLSREQGARMGGLVRELEVGSHERIDYREFLRQFAVEHENMRLSDDEFDYVFYTYGLELYGNVPLVEPLEYKSERRIRDFAIVIDTSSSVSAKVVQEFVDTTFDVLTSEGGFFSQTNIHIIQADARVQSDVKITSLADLDRWRRNIKLYGFGGTDFRPAFRYVQELRQSGEFEDLQGLVYFTDGWGIYPERMPPYKCAFVFYDEDHRPELVPPWAIQVVLHPGEFQSLSVY